MSSTPRAVAGASIDAGAADHLAPVYAQFPIDVVGASGVHLVTRDGRRVLDLYGGHAVAALGYGHPRWLAALAEQAHALPFQSNAVPLAVRARAAARLVRFAALPLDTVFFCNTGAEANENALKLALRITGRRKVVAVEGSFHGRTAAAGAVTWGAASRWYGFPQAPFDVEFLPRRRRIGDRAHRRRGRRGGDRRAGPGRGRRGRPGRRVARRRCARAATRPARCWCSTRCSAEWVARATRSPRISTASTPDMITTAKALGAGFPCAALLMSPDVARELATDDLGTTFGGGPLACAMVEAVIDIIEQEGLLANVRRLGALLRETCIVGPVVGDPGRGIPHRAAYAPPGEGRAARAARARHSHRHQRAIRTSCGYWRPTCSRNGTSSSCAMRLRGWRHEALHGPRGLRAR